MLAVCDAMAFDMERYNKSTMPENIKLKNIFDPPWDSNSRPRLHINLHYKSVSVSDPM